MAPKASEFLWGAASAACSRGRMEQTAGASPSGTSTPTTGTSRCRRSADHTGNDAINAYDHDQSLKDIALLRSSAWRLPFLGVLAARAAAGVGAVNKAGIGCYSRLVDDLLAAGIQPVVTLTIGISPGCCTKGGFHNHDVVDWFWYAGTMYRALGDRVDCFITMNEPFVDVMMMDLIKNVAPVAAARADDRRQYGRQIRHCTIFVASASAVANIGNRATGMVGLAAPLAGNAVDREPADVAAAAEWERFFNRWRSMSPSRVYRTT
jgi:beta-glucosidase/6-phospho-beta-glucosidase/beta-galactosidase